jgi:thioredoxin reductase
VRVKPLRQVATAIADGATAAIMAEKFIETI